MSRGLKNDHVIWTLARDLGLAGKTDPVGEIVEFCVRQMRALLKEFPCESLSQLLQIAATKFETVFREIHSDEELRQLRDEFLSRGEKEFALLETELGPDVFAITFRLLRPKRGEREFISIIDCRGTKKYRSYYSKWHELAHLFTLTDQLRFKFCRTHSSWNKKDPEETLMEVIAGQVGFLSDVVKPHAKGRISFDKIAKLREALCPEASAQASTIGFANNWPSPCVLLEASLEYKKSDREKLDQQNFDFISPPLPELRISHVNFSQPAADFARILHPNIRIPQHSIIYRTFMGGTQGADETRESLGSWETKKGGYLPNRGYVVSARKLGNSVQALLTPTNLDHLRSR